MKRVVIFSLIFAVAVLGFYLGRNSFRDNIKVATEQPLVDLPKPPVSDNSLPQDNLNTNTPTINNDFPISLAWLNGRCGSTVLSKSSISNSAPVYLSALNLLIKGPNAGDTSTGLISLISTRTVLKSVAIDGSGVITADFNKSLLQNIKTKCEATAMRQQITTTLEQFPEVRGVNILVNGLVPAMLSQANPNTNSSTN